MTPHEMPLSLPRQAGLCVRREREAQGLTQRQLAQRSRVSERTIISLELGDATGIRLDKLLAVLHALGIELLARKRQAPEGEGNHQVGSADTDPAQASAAPLPEKAASRTRTASPEGNEAETGVTTVEVDTCEYDAMLHDFLARTMSVSPAPTREETGEGERR